MNNLQIENIVNVVTSFVQYIDDIYCEIIIKSICKKGKNKTCKYICMTTVFQYTFTLKILLNRVN